MTLRKPLLEGDYINLSHRAMSENTGRGRLMPLLRLLQEITFTIGCQNPRMINFMSPHQAIPTG